MHQHVDTWKANLGAGPRKLYDLDLIPSAAALVVIDLQNYSTHPDCGWAPLLREHYPKVAQYMEPRISEVVLPNVRALLGAARAAGLRVIYLTLGSNAPGWSDMMPFHARGARKLLARYGRETIATVGTFEHAIAAHVTPIEGEIILNKVTKSAFTSTGIDQILRNLNVSQLILCGAATDACVESTGRDAADRGYECVMIDDACAAHDQGSHDASLRAFDRLFGSVMTTKEVIERIARTPRHSSKLHH